MTTPGGVPNLPVGALTVETLQAKTQDASVEANRDRAVERVPVIFDSSSGGNPSNDLSPMGFLTQLFSGFNSVVSKADPADINGPEDLPQLLVDFIEELPVVGQFVDLWNAINGTYDGDDEKLLAIQAYFAEMKSEREAVQAAWSGLFADFWSSLTSGKTLAQKLADLQAAWDSFAYKLVGIEADQTLTIVKVLQQLLPGLIPEGSELPTGIIDLQTEERAKQLAWNAMLQAGWDALASTTMTFPQKIAAVQAAWDVFAAKMGGIQADQTLTIQKLLNQFFPGLFPDGASPTNFMDNIRRSINQMIENWHRGYFDVNWQWVTSFTTPTAQLPGGSPAMTPGRNDDDTPAISSGVEETIPGAPTGAVAFPVWDLSVTDFPAGNITYAIAAVKNDVEGPAVMVKAFAGTLVPPNTNGRMDLSYTAPAGGADSYRIYRKVDDTYTTALDWRLVSTPTHDYPWLLSQPLSDKTVRTSGVAAHPKTDAELAAQVVSSVNDKVDATGDSMGKLAEAAAGSTDASAGDWAWLGQINAERDAVSNTALDMSVENSNTLGIRNNKPLIYGLDDTSESNIGIGGITPQTMNTVSAIITFVRCHQVDVKNTIAFVGNATGTMPTGVYVDFYRVNFDAGQLERLTSSANLAAQFSTDNKWFFVPTGGVAVGPGDVFAIGFRVQTDGQVRLYGSSSQAIPPHPLAKLQAAAGSYPGGTAATIPLSSISFTGGVNRAYPYVALESSTPPPPTYPDRPSSFTSSKTVQIASYLKSGDKVDLIGVGAGGDGQGNTGATNGRGASPGVWGTRTLTVGTDIPVGGSITVTVAKKGVQTPYFADGADGADTIFTWKTPDNVTQTLTCAGGLGGGLHNGSNTTQFGIGPGNKSYNGVTYKGGGTQTIPADGIAPGGGGAGASTFQYGWPGARGQAWIVERQA
ncbi:hypothetical protein PP713_08690 [Mycobacterium sp. CSUR Q5927]|nr:hypothetical protein [Mycobacterium sp. CSUR Q5927]